jgi:hypothetical protein
LFKQYTVAITRYSAELRSERLLWKSLFGFIIAKMANRTQLQDLLRFLTNEAKLSLAVAMGKVKAIQGAGIVS